MDPTSAGTPIVSSPATQTEVQPIPTLDQLLEWTSTPDESVVLKGVDWSFYEALADSIPNEWHFHLDYDGKDLEIMSPGMIHEGDRRLLAMIVEVVAQELEIPYRGLGQTTWKRPEIRRGLESDESYYFAEEKLTAFAQSWRRRIRNLDEYPNPDLAVEVDISRPKVDRAGIYAALQVPELWRLVDQQVVFERLQGDGSYQPVDRSSLLPVTAEQVRRWVVDEDSSDESAWVRRLRQWVREELVPARQD